MFHDGWQTEGLRLTIFRDRNEHGPGLLQRVIGTPPLSTQQNPQEGTVVEQAESDGNNLLMVSALGRLDWHIQPLLPSQQTNEPLVLKFSTQTIPLLFKALGASLENPIQANRLALGVNLIQFVDSPRHGHEILAQYLHDVELDTNSLDLMYRINKRRESRSIHGVDVNRLSTWSLEVLNTSSIQFNPVTSEVRVINTQSHCVRLAMDINTPEWPNTVTSSQLFSLLDEFYMLAQEIASHGDIS